MFTPFILFVGLTVATAVIAYWSDNLGKKLGKKRVSLFGLRPRTTATVLTVTSSWGIMLFTLVFLLATVEPLRRALFRYDADRARYQRDIGQAQEKLTGTQTQLTQTQASFQQIQTQLRKVRTSLTTAKQDVLDAQKEAKQAEVEGKKRASAAQQRAVAAQKKATVAQKRFQTAQSQFAAAQQRYLEAQRRASAAQGREAAARQGERQAAELVKQARANLTRARANLNAAHADLRSTNATLKTAQQSLQTATKQLFAATKETFARTKEVFALEGQRKQLLQQLDYYGKVATQLGGGHVGIQVGRTFAAGIIESGKSEKRIEENLRQLFEKGRTSLPALEPAPGATLELLPLPEIVGDKVVFLEGNAIFKKLAQEIVKSEEPTSVRLISARNFTSEETQIDARFVVVPVAPAFRAGEVLASGLIDGTSGDAGVFNKLLKLIEAGRIIASERKVDPPQSPEEQDFYASGTNVVIFAAMRRIEATGKTVRVRLVAADDLLTVEPLRVRFEIEGEESVREDGSGEQVNREEVSAP